MAEKPRKRARRLIVQAQGNLSLATQQIYSAMGPYFARYPEKFMLVEAFTVALNELHIGLEKLIEDV